MGEKAGANASDPLSALVFAPAFPPMWPATRAVAPNLLAFRVLHRFFFVRLRGFVSSWSRAALRSLRPLRSPKRPRRGCRVIRLLLPIGAVTWFFALSWATVFLFHPRDPKRFFLGYALVLLVATTMAYRALWPIERIEDALG